MRLPVSGAVQGRAIETVGAKAGEPGYLGLEITRSRRVIETNGRGRNDARIQHQMAEAVRYRTIGTRRPFVSWGRAAIVREVIDLLSRWRLVGVQQLTGHRLQRQPDHEEHQHGAAGERHESVRSSSSNYGWDSDRPQSE